MKYLGLIFFSFWFLLAYPQTFSLKALVGGNITFNNISNTLENKPKLGFDATLTLEKKLSPNFVVESGVQFENARGFVKREFIYPFDPSTIEPPILTERFTMHFLETLITIIFKPQTPNSVFIGTGLGVKFNIGSNRRGYNINWGESYSDNFILKTKSTSKFGIPSHVILGRELNKRVSLRAKYEIDLLRWQYPTYFEKEKHTYYPFRSTSFSLSVSYLINNW